MHQKTFWWCAAFCVLSARIKHMYLVCRFEGNNESLYLLNHFAASKWFFFHSQFIFLKNSLKCDLWNCVLVGGELWHHKAVLWSASACALMSRHTHNNNLSNDFMYINVLPACLSWTMCMVYLVLVEARRGHQVPWKWSYSPLSAVMWLLEIKSSSSGRTSALNQSLQPSHCFSVVTHLNHHHQYPQCKRVQPGLNMNLNNGNHKHNGHSHQPNDLNMLSMCTICLF